MPDPDSHLFEVELELLGFDPSSLDLVMPVWTPGSYLIREYERHLQDLVVTDATAGDNADTSVLMGTSGGGFASAKNYTLGSLSNVAYLVDMNGDGVWHARQLNQHISSSGDYATSWPSG